MPFADFDWSVLTQYTIDGLTFGALVALIALGYTMVYGIIGLINFAHGDVFMLGAFFAWMCVDFYAGTSLAQSSAWLYPMIPLLTVGAGLFTATVNLTINRFIYRPLRNAPKLAPLVSAIGVSFVLQNLGLLWAQQSGDFSVPEVVPNRNLVEGIGLDFTTRDLAVVVLVIPLMFGLLRLVMSTKLGKAMRAVQQNSVAAELMGIPVESVIAATFAIGGALAGAAGVIYALTIGTNNYQMGYQFGLFAFTAAVLGGIGSIPGAVVGGLVIGLIRAWTIGYLGAHWANTVIFGILVVILVFRPSGLLGRTVREKV